MISKSIESDRPWVVVVDDDLGVLASLGRLLRKEPYQVLATSDPLEALGALTTRNVRALVTDQRMPRMTGTELVAWTRARYPELPTVILSGYPDTARTVEREDSAVDHLVGKPWNDEELRSLLRHVGGFAGGSGKATAPLLVDCLGRTELEVLAQILPELELAREGGRELALVVEHLDRLGGALTRFLISLSRLAAVHEVKLTVLDPSGLAQTALQALGDHSRFVAAGRDRSK